MVEALHVSPSHKPWEHCSATVGSHFWTPNSIPSVALLPKLLKSGIQVLLFNGDLDGMCPGTGVEAMIADLTWNGATGFVSLLRYPSVFSLVLILLPNAEWIRETGLVRRLQDCWRLDDRKESFLRERFRRLPYGSNECSFSESRHASYDILSITLVANLH